MTSGTEIDVIVGGGGVAGLAAAAALDQLGYSVMVIEPGMDESRRLAGEVFHPPGVDHLEKLGLLPALAASPAITLDGFSVWSDGDCVRLPYSLSSAHRLPGLCLRHDLIRERMMEATRALPNVTVKHGMRVVGIDQSDSAQVVVSVAKGRDVTPYRCRLMIAADGSAARLARMVGIRVDARRIATIMGYRIGVENLPDGRFGHVFLGAETPILLYPIGDGQARILFDIPYRQGRTATVTDCLALSEVLPEALRREVADAVAAQPRMSLLMQTITVERAVSGRVVLVGDTGGSCHPLTATGMTMCVSDAVNLQGSMARKADDLPAALRLYQQRRRWPQATRLVLADALRDAFCAGSVERRVVRDGIFTQWRSERRRSAMLALLSTADSRPLSLMSEFTAVMVQGYLTHLRRPLPADRQVGAIRLARLLAVVLFSHARHLLWGQRVAS